MKKLFNYFFKVLEFLREYCTDMWLFMKHNNHSPFEDRFRRGFFQTIISSHTIEKGLSLPEPRPLFGRDKVSAILRHLRSYNRQFSEFPVGMAHGALSDYRDFSAPHAPSNDPTLEAIEKHLDAEAAPRAERTGGVKFVAAVGTDNQEAPTAFLTSRISCRMFVPDPLPLEQIEEVLRVAQSAPSQCNRQSVRVHFYQDRSQIAKLLRLQGGSAGFSETVGNLFVVTSEITAWGGPQQRNQLYVDGGLYSMMLMLALHAKGISSCPLNLAVTNSTERDIKEIAEIPSSQRLIMMIAAGQTADSIIRAARSPRCNVSDIAVFH